MSGGTSPYTYSWTPGGETTQGISNKPYGSYAVKVTDSGTSTATYSYSIGYKVNWNEFFGTVQKYDTIQNDGSTPIGWGSAVSKNTLAGGVDGWFEYVLKDLNQYKKVGFCDSVSMLKTAANDIDFGFYYAPSNNKLAKIINGVESAILTNPPPGSVLRVERVGNVIKLKVNGVVTHSLTSAADAARMWKVKTSLHSSNKGSLVNVGCSFSEQGNVIFPGYGGLKPFVQHVSSAFYTDGAISVMPSLNGNYTYSWMPGAAISPSLTMLSTAAYSLTIEDSLHNKRKAVYGVGHKVSWEQFYSTAAKHDTLINIGPNGWGQAISKNILAGSTDGWLEYTLRDVTKSKVIGVLDSTFSTGSSADIDYGFYYYADVNALYKIVKGVSSLVENPLEGSVLRVERIGSTITLKLNGAIVSSTTSATDASKNWKIKGMVLITNSAALVNVGCSFPLYNAGVTQQDINCIAGQNGSFTVTAVGGIPPYTYAFNNGGFSSVNTFTNLAAGTYTVDVQDGTGAGIRKLVDIVNCPKWVTPYSGVSVNAHGDILKTASDSSWINAVLTTEESFVFSDTAFWLSFETPDTASVFMLGFRTRINDSLLILSDSALQITNYKLYVENGMVTVVETDNDGFFNKFEIARATLQAGFKIRLTKSGIEYYRRPNRWTDYALVYVSKLFSPARLIVEQTLYTSGSRTNTVRVSSYGNTN